MIAVHFIRYRFSLTRRHGSNSALEGLLFVVRPVVGRLRALASCGVDWGRFYSARIALARRLKGLLMADSVSSQLSP
jgi:hypothetical protein